VGGHRGEDEPHRYTSILPTSRPSA
jgi:hypothetical protein